MDGRSGLGPRCTVVVAAAGYGKTAAVQRWLGRSPARWGAIPDLDDFPGTPRWLVLDDLRDPAGLLDALTARVASGPHQPRVVVTARWPVLPVPAAWRRTGLVVERGPADLALTADAAADLLRHGYGLRDLGLARRVHDVTAGWPALVKLAGAALRGAGTEPDDLIGYLAGPGTAVAAYLHEEVLSTVPDGARRLLRDLAGLGAPGARDPAGVGGIGRGLCRAIGHRRPGESMRWLTRTGLLVAESPGAARWKLVPLLARVVADRWPRPAADVRRAGAAAATWYAAHGRPYEAILAFRTAGEARSCARLLIGHAAGWVVAGGARTVADLVDWLPVTERSVRLRTLRGEALLVTGDDSRALAELGALADETDDGAGVPAAVAWRLGAVHYRRAEIGAAEAAIARGRTGPHPDPEVATLLALAATARWMAGDADGCQALAERAAHAAELADDDRARSSAQVALAMHAMLVGDRAGNATHYESALRYADAAGDVVEAARIRVNRSGRLLEEARYAETVAEARLAAGLAETAQCPAILAVALCNEGDALVRLARLEDATQRYERALAIFQSRRSRKMAYPLIGLGEVHRLCGRDGLALASYEEAVRVADEGEVQSLVPALAGLARVRSEHDRAGAVRAAARARALASGPYLARALLATGWVALACGDPRGAATVADEAAGTARAHRAWAALADALELRAAASLTPGTTGSVPQPAPNSRDTGTRPAAGSGIGAARRALREAAETWRVTGAVLDIDRVTVALGALPGSTIAERINGFVARERLELAGVLAEPAPSAEHHSAPRPAVVIRTLGRFEVSVAGACVPAARWRSRKARDLLRILLSLRGRPVPRERLVDLLWGDGEDPARLAHRLSVALSTLRGVLDPGRVAAQDQFVLADQSSVALDIGAMSIDVEAFLVESAHGLRLRDRGHPDDARAVLTAAERRYTGDFLADEPYEDWAVAIREEARAAYLHTIRALADLHRHAGRVDEAVRYLLRLLDWDRYDERAHQDLIDTLRSAGRHGESRRAHDRYLAAMADLDTTPPLRAGR